MKAKNDVLVAAAASTAYVAVCAGICGAISWLYNHDSKVRKEAAEEGRADVYKWLDCEAGYDNNHPKTVEIVREDVFGVKTVNRYKISKA